jgi:hypothetical protein
MSEVHLSGPFGSSQSCLYDRWDHGHGIPLMCFRDGSALPFIWCEGCDGRSVLTIKLSSYSSSKSSDSAAGFDMRINVTSLVFQIVYILVLSQGARNCAANFCIFFASIHISFSGGWLITLELRNVFSPMVLVRHINIRCHCAVQLLYPKSPIPLSDKLYTTHPVLKCCLHLQSSVLLLS